MKKHISHIIHLLYPHFLGEFFNRCFFVLSPSFHLLETQRAPARTVTASEQQRSSTGYNLDHLHRKRIDKTVAKKWTHTPSSASTLQEHRVLSASSYTISTGTSIQAISCSSLQYAEILQDTVFSPFWEDSTIADSLHSSYRVILEATNFLNPVVSRGDSGEAYPFEVLAIP